MINSKQKMWIRKRKANKLLSRPLAVLSSLSSLRLSAVFTATFEPSTTSLLTDRGCEGDSADIKTQTPEQTEIFPSRATGARSSSVQTDEEEEEEVEFGRRPPHPLGGWRGDEGGEEGIRFRHDVQRPAADFTARHAARIEQRLNIDTG